MTTSTSRTCWLLALAIGCVMVPRTAHAAEFPTVPLALASTPTWSMFWTAVKSVPGLAEDMVFNNTSWEATIYVPDNTAFTKFLAGQGMTMAEWTSNTDRVYHTILHHIVSSYIVGSFDYFYDGQVQSTLLTRLNNRSKLRIQEVGTQRTIIAEKSKVPMTTKRITAGQTKLVTVNGVLVPDLVAPKASVPKCTNAFMAIRDTPGLEDMYAAVMALPSTSKVVKDLNDGTRNLTVMAPNNYAMRWVTRALQLKPEDILFDTDRMSRVIAYHMVPGVTYLAADLKPKQVLHPALTGHTLAMQFYHNHEVVAGDLTKGKFVPQFPRKLNMMTNALKGNYDAKCGKHVVHVMDSWLLPSATP